MPGSGFAESIDAAEQPSNTSVKNSDKYCVKANYEWEY